MVISVMVTVANRTMMMMIKLVVWVKMLPSCVTRVLVMIISVSPVPYWCKVSTKVSRVRR